MVIIDNVNQLLGDDLKQTLQHGSKLKIAASCFSIYAFEALRNELENLDKLEFILHHQHSYHTKSATILRKSNENFISQNSIVSVGFTAVSLKSN